MTASGEVMREVPAHVELERWYRRLLWAYPVGYRRSHGEEILGMLMDSAEAGRRLPARADVLDLVRGAVRQWFRLPVGLPALVAAVLTAVILGAVGAASGSWLAWQTQEVVPDAVAVRVAETVAGAPVVAPFVDRRDGRRELGRGVFVNQEQSIPDWTLEAAQARLRADGWTLGRVQKSTPGSYRGDERLDAVYQVFQADRDGQTVVGYAHTTLTPDLAGTRVNTSVQVAAPGGEPAAVLLGWLVGAVTGWLLTGWAGYRFRRSSLPRRLAVLGLGLAALGLAAHPVIGLYRTLQKIAFVDNGVLGTAPAYYWVTGSPAGELVAGTVGAGLVILALAATARRRRATAPTMTAAI